MSNVRLLESVLLYLAAKKKTPQKKAVQNEPPLFFLFRFLEVGNHDVVVVFSAGVTVDASGYFA